MRGYCYYYYYYYFIYFLSLLHLITHPTKCYTNLKLRAPSEKTNSEQVRLGVFCKSRRYRLRLYDIFWLRMVWLHRSPEVKNIWPIESLYMTSYLTSIIYCLSSLYLVPFLRYLTSKFFQGLTSTFDFWMTPEVGHFSAIRNPIHDFLYTVYWHFLSISCTVFDIFELKKSKVWPLSFDL